MAQALITIDTVAGSNPPNGTPLVAGATVQLSNVNAGGELTYLWEFLDKPEGSLSAFSSAAIQNPTFVADSEGTYLIKLTVNRTLASEQVDTVIAAVKQLKSKIRIPAAGETQEESTSRGWAEDVNRALRTLDNAQADPIKIVAIANGSLSTGKVVYIDAMSTIKSGLPGEEMVPRLALAQATSPNVTDQALYVVHSKVGGGTSISSGELCYVSAAGVIGPLSLGSGSALDRVYVDDSGGIDTTAGTYPRGIGHIVFVDGGDYYIAVDGSAPPTLSSTIDLGDGVTLSQVSGALTATAPAGITFNTSAADVWEITSTGELAAVGTLRYVQNVKSPALVTDGTNKAYVDSVAGTAFTFGNSSTPGTTTQSVLDPGYCDREATTAAGNYPEILCPITGVVTNLYINARVAADANVDFTVYIDGTATGITKTIVATGLTGYDTTHTAAITAGQRLCVQVKAAAGITTGFQEITATVFVKRA